MRPIALPFSPAKPPSPAKQRRGAPRGIVVLILLSSGALSPSCTDIRDYKGTWTGHIEPNPSLREGLSGSTSMTLVISRIDRGALEGRITIAPSQADTAGFTDATLIPMTASRADALGDIQFDGDPIATYLFSIAPDDPEEEHATLVISAHPDKRIQVRLIRYDLYGLFRLRRVRDSQSTVLP